MFFDAEQSKLILKAIADANWKTENPFDLGIPVLNTFNRLGATAKDGWKWKFGDDGNLVDQARKWVNDHVDSFRIKRYVSGRPHLPLTSDSK